MKIKIKALADIEFLSAKVDRKHNIFTYRQEICSILQDRTVPFLLAQVANT